MLALSLENVLADVDVLVDMGTTSLVTLLLVLSCCIALSISSQLDSVKRLLLASKLGTQTTTSAQAKAKVTEEQKLAYKQKADAMVIEMLEYTSPKTAVPWRPIGTVDGAAAFQASMPGSDVVCVKGVIDVTVSDIDEVKRGFTDINSDKALFQMMVEVDQQFFEGCVLGLVEQAGVDAAAPPVSKMQLEWHAFRAPPVYPRDFCWLSVMRTTRDAGQPAFLSICSSVERDECPGAPRAADASTYQPVASPWSLAS